MPKGKKSVHPLWTRDFTIITLGSVVSMMGNAMSGFAMSLLVLDYTNSAFLYAMYLAVFTLPQMLMPIFSGAYLDRFSRKKTIYTLDFISAGLYALMALILKGGWFSFPVLASYAFALGSIQSIYMVAYDSLYPLLITEGNYSKAYSISSVLETLSSVMIPISTYFYRLIGIAPLLAVNAGCFLAAAIMETRIRAKEDYIEARHTDGSRVTGRQILRDIGEGFRYLRGEPGLMAVAAYFTFIAFAGGADSVIVLPYFKESFANGEYVYMLVWGMMVVGRAIGGGIHYAFKIPTNRKFAVALTVYIVSALLEAFVLYMPVPVMMPMCLICGLCGVTSYTIRVSATQSYVPHEKKGRFNGAFNMLNTFGAFTGELAAGALTGLMPMRTVLTAFMLLNAVAAAVLIGGSAKQVKPIYNTQK